jgi:hypothetical protein
VSENLTALSGQGSVARLATRPLRARSPRQPSPTFTRFAWIHRKRLTMHRSGRLYRSLSTTDGSEQSGCGSEIGRLGWKKWSALIDKSPVISISMARIANTSVRCEHRRSWQPPPRGKQEKQIDQKVDIRESRISAGDVGAEVAVPQEEEGEDAVEHL